MKTKPSHFVTAASATAATLTTANAGIVQITQTDNYISSSLNQLNLDFTGDGNDDITLGTSTNTIRMAQITAGDVIISATFTSTYTSGTTFRTAKQFFKSGTSTLANYTRTGTLFGSAPTDLTPLSFLLDVNFSDSRINNGGDTEAWLEFTLFASSSKRARIEFTRIIFNDDSTSAPTGISAGDAAYTEWVPVPEPSSLSLLALGAAGILTRRNRKAA